MIKILVVDDHALMLAGLCRILESDQDLHVVGTAGTGRQAVELCRELKPDVVLLDFSLPDFDGLEVTERILSLDLGARVLIVTMHASPEYATRALRAGASGFMIKESSTSELLTAIHKVAGHGVYVTPSIMEEMVTRIGQPETDTPESVLSDREMQVLVRLAEGAKTREVSTSLGLSISTVETYRSRILHKLNLRTTADITRFAIRRGLIAPE